MALARTGCGKCLGGWVVKRFLGGAGLLLAALSAQATNGYLAHGYGVKSKGQAGVGIASPQDALTIATNPAGLVAVGDGLEIGFDVFVPRRSATLVQDGTPASYSGNGTSTFIIPEAAFGHHLTERVAVGVALFGNGGINTDYVDNPFARFGAQGPAGVDLLQAFVSPAVAFRATQTQSFGVAVNFAYQRFRMKGIEIFGAFSSDPARVSNQGYDDSTGVGVRVGWTGQFGPHVTLGATWQSRTEMGRFDKYRGLFADQGGFDIPENYGLGIAIAPTDALTVSFDWQRILYSDIHSVGNPLDSLFAGVPLGASDGPGFGWRDVDALKLGVSYRLDDRWTVRGGLSHAAQPIPASQTFFNTLAPGVVETHLTLGSSWKFTATDEISVSYLHAFRKTVNGSGSIPPGFGGGEVNLSLQEDAIGVAYSRSF